MGGRMGIPGSMVSSMCPSVPVASSSLPESRGGFQALTNGFGDVTNLLPSECGPAEGQNPLEDTALLASLHQAPFPPVSVPLAPDLKPPPC